MSRNAGRNIAASAITPPAAPVGDTLLDRAQKRGEREQRSWHCLGRAVAGQELVLADEAGIDGRGVQQGQDDVAPPKTSAPEL